MATAGLDSWTSRVLGIAPGIKAAVRDANNQNALDFMQQVASRVPMGDREPHLASTLAKEDVGEMGVKVSIGGPEAPYPAHLEFGHMAKGGKHVPAEPFWFPTLRVNKARFRNRVSRALRTAVRAICASPGGG